MISVIFCGGYGTRMNNGKPGTLKPLIEVAGKAILLHIITIYNKFIKIILNTSTFWILG